MPTSPERYGGGVPRFKRVLDALNSLQGSAYSTDPTSAVYAENYAMAREIACVWEANRRLANQWDPLRMTDFLPRWEKILKLSVAPSDSPGARRRRVAERRGRWGMSALVSELSDVLRNTIGQNFVSLRHLPADGTVMGTVTSIVVNSSTSDFTGTPTVTLVGGGGSGATATAHVVSNTVTSVTVTTPGAGYFAPPTVAFFGGGGSGVSATAVLNGGVVSWWPLNPNPHGAITSVTMTQGGLGYTSAPSVSFSGGGGTGATAVASIAAGVVTGVAITSPGLGYTLPPTVSFSGGGGTGAMATSDLLVPWSSTTYHLQVNVQRVLGQTQPQFNAAMAQVNTILDDLAPAWFTWDWVIQPNGYSGSPTKGFVLAGADGDGYELNLGFETFDS